VDRRARRPGRAGRARRRRLRRPLGELNAAERTRTLAELRGLGFQPAASQTNFVWFRAPDSLGTTLGARGIQVNVRNGAARVTLGTSAEMRAFIAALKKELT
jgi:histidinol-phosphate/aromatic aminotransferase/cobyric acid decarboxylase-like protein